MIVLGDEPQGRRIVVIGLHIAMLETGPVGQIEIRVGRLGRRASTSSVPGQRGQYPAGCVATRSIAPEPNSVAVYQLALPRPDELVHRVLKCSLTKGPHSVAARFEKLTSRQLVEPDVGIHRGAGRAAALCLVLYPFELIAQKLAAEHSAQTQARGQLDRQSVDAARRQPLLGRRRRQA